MASAAAMATRSLFSSPTSSRQTVATVTAHSPVLPWLPFPSQASSPAFRLQGREPWKSASHCGRIAGNIVVMATGEAPSEVATELPEIFKTIQEAWDKLEDKYAVTSLTFFALIALYGSAGLISAIDKLPLLPSIFELVGIGYTGWFAYRNIVFKPDREALIAKIKSIYGDVIGSS
ncbi:protein CURVATURE THYLAKOID 1B, chloroplastic [Phalaenopsis equestris]|uniref:protein CURVATURE THYLAKOID 1B, chloroplastic n=1 Tax=Phalaenopsis equestris TaxID=78828 RepID=UPI0009E2857E|nr:protein CURVATURE THYLAKOID 1B, chloroplastic [Phalaenopsis equestris]